MNNSGITINDSNVIRALREFEPRQMASVNRRALAASSMVLVRAARLKLRGVTERSQSSRTADRRGWSNAKSGKRLTTLENGIRFRVNESGTVSRTNIMGDFRLKFFEAGAGVKEPPRKKRSGASTGVMTARPFFHPAFRASQAQMYTALANSLTKSINDKLK